MSLAEDMNKLGQYTPAPPAPQLDRLSLFMQTEDKAVLVERGNYVELFDLFNSRTDVLYACIHDGQGVARFTYIGSYAMITP